jgi:histidyl-tRNA synthetase
MQAVIQDAPRLMDELGEASLAHFNGVQDLLRQAGVAYEINPNLVRGLDYYNLTVFEWVTNKLGAQGTICAGGRYDGLIEQIGGKPQPACGFAMGVERLLALLVDAGMPHPTVHPDVYVVHQGEAATAFAWQVAEALRDCGLHIILHAGGGSFKSQMRRADASGAAYAVIIGDDEATAREVSLKSLRGAGEQVRLPADAAAARIQQDRSATGGSERNIL